jgi:hypothetical protein
MYGQQQTQRDSLQHLCVGTDQTGVCHWSDLCTPVRPVKLTGQTFAGVNRGRPPNVAREGYRRGGARRVALESARPPRTPSIDVETKEEEQVIDWKSIRQREKVKI